MKSAVQTDFPVYFIILLMFPNAHIAASADPARISPRLIDNVLRQSSSWDCFCVSVNFREKIFEKVKLLKALFKF